MGNSKNIHGVRRTRAGEPATHSMFHDQQAGHPWGLRCAESQATALLSQNLHFNKVPWWFLCILTFKKHWSGVYSWPKGCFLREGDFFKWFFLNEFLHSELLDFLGPRSLLSALCPLWTIYPSTSFYTPSSYTLPSWPAGSCQQQAHSAVKEVKK